MVAVIQVFNIISKIMSMGIFNKFFNKHPKTGASAGATVALILVTNLFGYLNIGITPDQALEISEGLVVVGGLFMAHFAPSPMKKD